MLLICYDGSDDAKAAIAGAGEFLSGPAEVLTVWQPLSDVLSGIDLASGFPPGTLDVPAADQGAIEAAEKLALEGAALAHAAGFDAEPRTRVQETNTADAILAEAQDSGTSGIVIGSRGLGRVKSVLLGSVSHAVLHRADRPVIVVPSDAVASARRRHRDTTPEPS